MQTHWGNCRHTSYVNTFKKFWQAHRNTYTHKCTRTHSLHVCHIHTPYSITDELLPAHDKSPPVCGISLAVHVGARPDPTASALSPTTWGPAWMTDWLMGESHLTKSISDWSSRLTWAPEGSPACQRLWAPTDCTFPGLVHLTPWGRFPSTWICVVITAAMWRHILFQNYIIPTENTHSTPGGQEN